MRRTDARRTGLSDRSSSLDWATMLLWGTQARTDPPRSPTSDGPTEFFVLPSLDRPRLLVPASSRPAAAATLRQFNDSMTHLARLRKGAASLVFRAGFGSHLARDRVWIDATEDRRGEGSIQGFLSGVFGRNDLLLGITLGPTLRPNVKPIIQVLTASGDVLGYVKVGWNDLTRRSVENEARAVRAWGERTPATFCVPRLLFAGRWNDLAITAVSPVDQHILRRRPRMALPPIEVLREIAGSAAPEPLGSSAYLVDLAARVGSSSLGDDERGRTVRIVELVRERAGDPVVPFGAWHGDLGPWNMCGSPSGLFIWDWERSSSPVPIGFDVLHFGFQVQHMLRGSTVAAAARASIAGGRAQLLALNVPTDVHGPLLATYLIERILRLDEGRANGVPIRSHLTGQILEFLEMEGVS